MIKFHLYAWIQPILLASALLTLSSCGSSPQPPLASDAPVEANPDPSETVSPSPDADRLSSSSVVPDHLLISSEGIGDAKLGMTLGDLKASLDDAKFVAQPLLTSDFDAIAVRQNEETSYYILHLAGESFGDDNVIQGLMTTHPDFKTAEAIGPETTIREAEAAYGKAILSYHTQNESREYVRFENHPTNNVSFSTGIADENLAGLYPSPHSGYNETSDYTDDATIQSVLVVCLVKECSG
jgi:hypothetical protein